MTDVYVQPGGEKYERWAKNKLTALGQVRADVGLPVMRKHYVPETGVRVDIESSDYGDRIRIFSGVDFGYAYASRAGLSTPSTFSTKGKQLQYLDHGGAVAGSVLFVPSKAAPHRAIRVLAVGGMRIYYNGQLQSTHTAAEYASAFSLAGDKFIYWHPAAVSSPLYALAIPVATGEVYTTDLPAAITDIDPQTIPAFAAFLNATGASTWVNGFAVLNDQTLPLTWSVYGSPATGPSIGSGQAVAIQIDPWKAKKAVLAATVWPVTMSPDANDGTFLTMNATFRVATGILEIDFETGTQTLTVVQEDPIVVPFQATIAFSNSTVFTVPAGRRTSLYLQPLSLFVDSFIVTSGNAVTVASDGSSVVLIGKADTNTYTTTLLCSSDVYWRGAVRGVTLTSQSVPIFSSRAVVDASDKLSFVYVTNVTTSWYYDGVSTTLRSTDSFDRYLQRSCLSKDGQNVMAAAQNGAAAPTLFWYRRTGTTVTLDISDRDIDNTTLVLNTDYSQDAAFFVSYLDQAGANAYVAPLTLHTDPDTLAVTLVLGAGIKETGSAAIPSLMITPFNSIPAA